MLEATFPESDTSDVMYAYLGPCPEKTFPASRIALSVPLINAHIEPISTAPILASHPFDLQHFPPSRAEEEVAHVGPPTANVEVKLVASSDVEVDQALHDPVGKVRPDRVLNSDSFRRSPWSCFFFFISFLASFFLPAVLSWSKHW